jgi:hypothetical protein
MRRILVTVFATLAVGLLALPGVASASALNGLTISPSVVNNGASATGDLQMAFADPAPTTVLLFSSDPSAAQVPASIVVPPLVTEVFFTITSTASAPATGVQITAAVDNVPRVANLAVNFGAPAGPTLKSISTVPTSIVAGANATGTVAFTGAMNDGAVVNLTSSNPAAVQVPAQMVVNQFTSSGTFQVTTSRVTAATTVTLTATWFGKTATTTVKVAPGTPPAADKVTIKKAEWRPGPGPNGTLKIEATSTNPNAILSVYTATGSFMFDLTNNGGGKFSDTRLFMNPAGRIEVRSNFGGSAFANTQ